MHAQARFERSLVVLFRLPRILMLVLLVTAILAMSSGRPCPEITPAQAVEATNQTMAYLHGGRAHEGGQALGTVNASSDSDESARLELFGMFPSADVPCSSIQHGELMWHYLDDDRIDHGPYSESVMREWWIRGHGIRRLRPHTMVRVVDVVHHVRLSDIYSMGNPPTWRPTTLLSELGQGPEYEAAAPTLGESSTTATGAADTDAQQESITGTVKEKDEEVLCPSEEATLTYDEDVNKTPLPVKNQIMSRRRSIAKRKNRRE